VPYSTIDDLLLGDLPLGSKIDPIRFVQDAADEIDSVLGFRYVTPIDVSDSADTKRYVKLLLKRINNHLASGRLILAADIGGEDSVLHAYGVSLIQEATAALCQIVNGTVSLEGAAENEVGGASTGPTIINEDERSGVAAFYGFVSRPWWWGRRLEPHWRPGDDDDRSDFNCSI
jgi:phage gp36-like protein